MSNGRHYSCPLYDDFIKYGFDNFTFEVLEYTSDFINREKYYIELYNAKNNGYNVTSGGQQPPTLAGEDNPFCEHSEEEVEKLKHEIKFSKKSFRKLAKEHGYKNEGTISRINMGIIWRKDDEEYPLRKNSLSEEDVSSIIDLLKNTNKKHKEIAEIFNIARTTVTAINSGANNKREGISYPVRKL